MRKTNSKPDIGRQRWHREIQQFIEATKRRGYATAVMNEMNRIGRGKKWARQQVAMWLHKDKAKRFEPSLGIGLVLLDVCRGVLCRMEREEIENIRDAGINHLRTNGEE